MAEYKVIFSKRAVKALAKIDPMQAALILAWIEKNLHGTENPRQHGKALRGDKKGYWRYRVGSYRILAEINDTLIVISIINVAHRREVYE